MSAPVDRSTTWPYEDGEPGRFSYSRYSSPTLVEAETRLGALDGGDALLFASGMAASTSLVLAVLSSGATVAVAEGAYYGTSVMLDELDRWGITRIEFDQRGPPPDGVDLIWVERPRAVLVPTSRQQPIQRVGLRLDGATPLRAPARARPRLHVTRRRSTCAGTTTR
jgi:cystathionine beta-lyase/cystathionine gamma-synthase